MINTLTVDTSGMTDKQAIVAFGEMLKHRRNTPHVKGHTYEKNTLNVNVKVGKTIRASKV